MSRKIESKGRIWEKEFSYKREVIGELMRLPVVREILRDNEATWLANPSGGSILDIGFVPKRRKGREFVGTELFGEMDCVGVVVCEEMDRQSVWQKIRRDRDVGGLLEQGGRVVVLTEEELECWVGFYSQLDDEGILERVGKRALAFSGLRRYSKVECENLTKSLNLWIERDAVGYFEAMGVSEIRENRGRLDVAFMNEKGELVPIPMYHVRTGEVEGEVLVERVLEESVVAPGWVVIGPSENKREAYERARNLTRYYKNRIGAGYRVCVPVVSVGQISLWQKLGFSGEIRSEYENRFGEKINLSVNEVLRFLYLGKSNIEPGELVQYGLSLPSLGREFKGVDVLFYANGGAVNNRRFVAVDGLKGINLRKRKKSEEDYLPVANVRGLVILPDGMKPKEMREYVKDLQKDVNYRTLGPDGYLLYLTPTLFRQWISSGSAFLDDEENGIRGGVFSDIGQRVQYGYGVSGLEGVTLEIYRQKPEIGGTKMIVWEEGNKQRVGHGIDWGTSFTGPRALQEITAREPTAFGIGPSLEVGRLPMVPGVYDVEYLLASIRQNPNIGYVRGGDVVSSFIRAELCRQSSEDEVARVVGRAMARKIFEIGQEDVRIWYKDIQQVLKTLLLSHGHIDHCGEVPYLIGAVPIFTCVEGEAHLKAMTSKGVWRSRYDRITHVVTRPKIGSRYQITPRELVVLYWMNQRVRLSPNLSAEAGLINHSMTGTLQWGILDSAGQGLLLNTGDFRMGDRTKETLEKFAGKYPVIVMETTNLEDEGKTSIGITEEVVRETMLKIVRESEGKTIIAVIPPNHIERMDSIIKVAELTGRKIALDVKHAEVVEQLRVSQYMMPYADGFDFGLPEIGDDVALWWSPKTQPKTYQRLLRNKARGGSLGVVDSGRLSRQGRNWIVVISPYNLFRHVFTGVNFRNGLAAMHCSFYPYQANAKIAMADNIRWVNNVGRNLKTNEAKYYSDFTVHGDGGRVSEVRNYFEDGTRKVWSLHASGHATFEEMAASIDILLDGVYKGKTLVLMHGQNPRLYKQKLQEKLGREIRIIADIAKYDPTDPINNPGFKLRLV